MACLPSQLAPRFVLDPRLLLLQDLDSLKEVVSANFGHELKVSSMSAKGRNWGDAVLDNETLQFHTDGRALFNVALPDVVQVQDQ